MRRTLHDKVTVTSDCWIWNGGRNGPSGQHSWYEETGRRRRIPAHVAIWLDAGHEPIPRLHYLSSTCDNDLCVRPEHREIRTISEVHMIDPKEQAEAFWARVDKSRDCWEWTGGTGGNGYGHVNYQNQRWGTHRLAYYLTGGDPGDMFVRHTCDNPPCCRPDHLLPGTAKQNTADMFARGRQHRRDGIYSHLSKLTAEDVRTIRREVAAGTVQRRLAERYGVSVMVISNVVLRKTYQNV